MSEHDSQNVSQSHFLASDKERFDLCIAMLKAYYEALEGRAGTFAGFLVVVIGWLITSEGARRAIAKERWFFGLALATLTLMLLLYAFNVTRWVQRWREIRSYVDALSYVEPRFYARYELVDWAWAAYFTPAALLYAFIAGLLVLITSGRFA